MSVDLLRESVAKLLGVTPLELDAHIRNQQVQARLRAQARDERYARAMGHLTDVQAVVIDKLVRDGWRRQERIWQNRKTANIAIVLHKSCWNAAKGRLGSKITVVYPDGSRSETFEKRISIKENF